MQENSAPQNSHILRYWPLFTFASAIAVLALLVATPNPKPNAAVPSSETVVLTSQAFGDLKMPAADGRGGSTEGNATLSAVTNDTGMIFDGPGTWYRYGFEGDLSSLLNENGDVYRAKSNLTAANMSGLLSALNLSEINTSLFERGTIAYLSISDNESQGYSLSVDSVNGNLSLMRSGLSWPMLDYNQQLTEDDVPANETVIATAQSFLARYGVDTSTYGEPVVQDLNNLPMTEGIRGIPPNVQVTFPAKIDENLFAPTDTNQGAVVWVSLLDEEVESASISVKSYEKSSYPLLTDTERLNKIISRGGIYNAYTPEGATIVDIALHNPTRVLMNWYTCEPNGADCKELLVPALRFDADPAPDMPGAVGYPIVFPLVEEIIDSVE